MTRGIIYVLTNPAMPDLIKIGKTTNLDQRLSSLYSTGVPLPFECIYAKEVEDMDFVETKLHAAFDSKRLNNRREFFKILEEELIHFLHHVKHKNCKIVSIHSNPNNKSLDYSYMDIDLHVDQEADHLDIVPTCSIAVFTVFLQSVACEISAIKKLTIEQFVRNHPGGSIGQTKI